MLEHFARKLINTIGFLLALLFKVFVSILLTCIIGPIFLLVWLINETARLIVSILLYTKFGHKIHLVPSGEDNIWHYEKPGNNRVCLLVAFCKDPINLETYRELFQTRVLNHITPKGLQPFKKLKKTFITKFGYHCFRKDDDFDLVNHINICPGLDSSNVVTESELMTKILPELSKDLDATKPQWEDLIIPRVVLKEDGKVTCARILRYHHGYLDGASFLMMWANCMTSKNTPAKAFPYPVDPLRPSTVPKCTQILMNMFCFIMAAWTMAKTYHIGMSLKNRYVTPKFTGTRHFGWSSRIDVNLLRQIKSVTKVSLPTILSTVVAAVVRKMDKTHPSKNPEFRGEIAEKLTVGMVNAIIPYPDICPRNHFTITHFSLATGDMSWFQRVQLVNKEMKKLRWDPVVYLNLFMFKFFGRFPVSIVQQMMENGGVPISFSNVPFTNKPITLWDNEVSDCGGWPPLLTNTGFGIVTLRYADHMRFCCMTDDACLSQEELQFFLSEVVTEIHIMAEECNNSLSNQNHLIISIDPMQNPRKNSINQVKF